MYSTDSVLTFIGLLPVPGLSTDGSAALFLLVADALSFLLIECALDLGTHFGFPSPGSLAQAPFMLPFVSNLTQSPFGPLPNQSFNDSLCMLIKKLACLLSDVVAPGLFFRALAFAIVILPLTLRFIVPGAPLLA